MNAHEMADEESPLIKALPPATDYVTYLTIIEYNLTPDNLPILHRVLQDTVLTANIGWDLVHLLIPLLPASEQCLQDIARLGNPREVLLKVTESLRLLDFEAAADSLEEYVAAQVLGGITQSKYDTVPAEPGEGSSHNNQAIESPPSLPLPVLQFQILLSMLSILHPRIKTKYPSRFLSTSLQAVLAGYANAQSHRDELTTSIIKLVKTLSGTKRPHLPPRMSSSQTTTLSSTQTAPDPEAQPDPPSTEEDAMLNRLLQSFITHVLEEYLLLLSSDEDVPGLAWGSRLQEKLHPERNVPGRTTYAERFAKVERLQGRTSIVGQIVAVAQDLNVTSEELRNVIKDPAVEASGLPTEEDEPPSSADDIPLSKTGALFLFVARKVSEILYGSQSPTPGISIFPEHAAIVRNFISMDMAGRIGLEPEPLIDTILSLGLLAVANDDVGQPASDDEFARYLQATSLLSANTLSPTLRYLAHYLTSTVLRSHPSDLVRLSFIRDTLEHCPYENLKASAVSWLKGETLEANAPPGSAAPPAAPEGGAHTSIFATPMALAAVAPALFPELSIDLLDAPLADAWMLFKTNFAFYLAALNLYYLLLAAKHLHKPLDVPGLHEGGDLGGSYLYPLRRAAGRFREGLEQGGELAEAEGAEGVRAGLGDLMILEDALDRVEGGVREMNVTD